MTKRKFEFRKLAAIVICLVGITVFSGCEKDPTDDPNGNGNGTEEPGDNPGGTLGEWKMVENPAFSNSGVNAIVYDGNKFVAVGNESQMAYSTDGINWTAVANTGFTKISPINGALFGIADIAFGGGKYVAVGGSNQMAYSTDGVNWTATANTGFLPSISVVLNYDQTSILCVAYGNGKFVAGGLRAPVQDDPHGAQIAYSTDGINWTNVDASLFGYGPGYPGAGVYVTPYATNSVNTIVYENGRFVAGGKGIIGYSTDGINWTAATNHPFSINMAGTELPLLIYDIAYGAGKYVAVGQQCKMAYSTDCINWTEVKGDASIFDYTGVEGIVNVTYANGKFIATGNVNGRMAYSTDGITWTGVSTYIPDGFGSGYDAIRDIAYGAGKFVAVGSRYNSSGNKARILYCND